jgi:DNA-directed RNA polymerase subunit RPC12/RpoP
MFEDNDISLWFTDAKCADCGALVTVPTPVDDNENNFNTDCLGRTFWFDGEGECPSRRIVRQRPNNFFCS